MNQVLHLGVIDVPYVEGEAVSTYRKRVAKARQGRQRLRATTRSGDETTGDVATILEAKYGLFTAFYEHHEDEIAALLASSMTDSLDNLMAGAPLGQNPYGAFEQGLILMFRKAIETQEFDGYAIPGVPTRAAREGVNHRLKRNRGAPRPSFRDTGLMEASFIAWLQAR